MLYNPGMPVSNAAPFPISDFRRRLLSWFNTNARDLPWRRTRDPYAIWISEIMLQQTRVAAVIEHYTHFLTAFPTLLSLALAPEKDVLAAWSGLGYYRRARHLQQAAQLVVHRHRGSLPGQAAELRKLPGIGAYTSAAIASIAFGDAEAAVDGNVERVIERLAPAIAKKGPSSLRRFAGDLLDPVHPGAFNQAMMELGATVCLPQNPHCDACPVEVHCRTHGPHPARKKKQMSSRQVDYALVMRTRTGRSQVLLEQRPQSVSQMPGMWELPAVKPGSGKEEDAALLTLRHSITSTNYYVRILRAGEREGRSRLAPELGSRRWIAVADLPGVPLTGLARKVLRRLKMIAQPVTMVNSLEVPVEQE